MTTRSTLLPRKRIWPGSATVWGIRDFSVETNVRRLEARPRAYVSAVLPGGLGGQALDPLPVQLGRTAAVLGVGVIRVTPVLMEKGRLRRKGLGLTAGLR